MADELDLRHEALKLLINLTPDFDFVRTIEAVDPGFTAGDQVSLTFNDTESTEWIAEIVGNEARWNIDKVEVNALIARRPDRARLAYKSGDVDLPWARGRVTIDS